MSAELSIILPTDTYGTIRPVLEHVRRQTIADRLEIVLVVRGDAEIPEPPTPALQIVRARSTSSLAAARAAGVAAANAPFIFMGETHSYLHPDAAAKLLAAAHAGGWSAVSPAVENANPRDIFSWANFLADYGRWTSSAPAGEIHDVPLFNALYRRVDLPQTSEQLERVFAHGDEISVVMRAGDGRIYFEPAARIAHLNLNTLARSSHEQFLAGALIGRQRAQRWPFPKRLLYMIGSPLIPFVLFCRNFSPASRAIRAHRLSWLTLPAMFLLKVAKAAGEFIGYAGLCHSHHESTMDEYEIRKRDYVTS